MLLIFFEEEYMSSMAVSSSGKAPIKGVEGETEERLSSERGFSALIPTPVQQQASSSSACSLVEEFAATFFTSQSFFDDLLYSMPTARVENVYEMLALCGVDRPIAQRYLEHLSKSEAASSGEVAQDPIIVFDKDRLFVRRSFSSLVEAIDEKCKGLLFPEMREKDSKVMLDEVRNLIVRIAERGGYYTAGHVGLDVSFLRDFCTYPMAHTEIWGSCLVHNAYSLYRNWYSQQRELSSTSRFLVGEAGAGGAYQAVGFLEAAEALAMQDKESSAPSLKDFYQRLIYRICEISPTLSEVQRKRLERFIREGKASVQMGDVRRLSEIGQGEGISAIYIPLNEVFDALPFGKFRRTEQGIAMALMIPLIPQEQREQLSLTPEEWAVLQQRSDLLLSQFKRLFNEASISKDLKHRIEGNDLLLNRDDLERIELRKRYIIKTGEIFLPVHHFPDILQFFERYPCYDNLSEGEEFFVSTEMEKVFENLVQHLGDKNIQLDIIDYGYSMPQIEEYADTRTVRCYPRGQDRDPLSRDHRTDITVDVNFTILKHIAERNGFRFDGYSSQSSLLDPSDPLIDFEKCCIYSGKLLDQERNFRRMVLSRGAVIPQINALPEPLEQPDLADEEDDQRSDLALTTLWPASDYYQEREPLRLIAGFIVRELRKGQAPSELSGLSRRVVLETMLKKYLRDADEDLFLSFYDEVEKELPLLLQLARKHQILDDAAFVEIFDQFQRRDECLQQTLEFPELFADLVKNVLFFYFQHRSSLEEAIRSNSTLTGPSLGSSGQSQLSL